MSDTIDFLAMRTKSPSRPSTIFNLYDADKQVGKMLQTNGLDAANAACKLSFTALVIQPSHDDIPTITHFDCKPNALTSGLFGWCL